MGYYHLKFNNNQSANITYIDFNTKAHVFLNSDISSTYSNSTDPSWLPFGAVSLFWNNDKLYCVTPSNVSADALSTQIVQMDANGTNSKSLVSIPSNQSMLRGIATDGDNLYTTLETVKENGEAYFSFSKISLSDGTITELLQLDTTDVLFGVYKDKCYFKSLKMIRNPFQANGSCIHIHSRLEKNILLLERLLIHLLEESAGSFTIT